MIFLWSVVGVVFVLVSVLVEVSLELLMLVVYLAPVLLV